MRLLDIGCYNGDSTLQFASNNSFSEILAFDPNDTFKDLWSAIERRYPHVKFHNGAIYTYDGMIEYTQRPEDVPLGSTIMKNKNDWGKGDVKNVQCFDILEYIVPNTSIKIDGEGSEYDILERVIDNDYLKYIDMLYIEWHDSKLKGPYGERHRKIQETLEREGKKVKTW